MALAGGVNRILTPGVYAAFSAAGMLAPDGRCRLSTQRQTASPGGKAAELSVLKRLADAERAGDRVLGLILGSAVNQDGRSSGLTAPNGPAQETVIRRALEFAGINPLDIQYVEAHGTGTALGDPIEVQALAAVLCSRREAGKPLRIGSVKTNNGHLEAAAGIAGLIKVVIALGEKTIPPQMHFNEPNRHIEWDGLGIDVVTEAVPWHEGRRLAGVSSFGFGGTNAHIVMERATHAEHNGTTESSGSGLPSSKLRISAKTPEWALRELTARYATHLETAADQWSDIGFASETRRARFEHNLTVTANSSHEACGKLREFSQDAPREGSSSNRPSPITREQTVKLGSASAGYGMASLPVYPFQRKSFWLSGRQN